MPLALLTLSLQDSDGDTSPVSAYVNAGAGDTIDSLSEDYAHVLWDAIRPLVNGVLIAVSVSFKADFSAWTNNTAATTSDVEEKAVFSLRVCGGNRPVRFSLPTAKESIFTNSGAGRFVDETQSDYVAFAHVLENGVVDNGIGMTDSHGNDICGIHFGEQFSERAEMSDNITDVIQQLAVPRYAPRIKPTPIPGAAWNEAPLFCLKLNDEWVSHVLGVMTALDQADAWEGTDDEIYAARQQVNEIMAAFMQMCEEPMLEFRVNDCDLQWRENVDDEWHSLGNVCGDDGVDGHDGADGATGPQGETGPQGPAGETGATGSQGEKGDCCGLDDNDPPEDDTNEKLCGIATYLVKWNNEEWVDIIQRVQAAADSAAAVADVIAAVAGVGILTGSLVAVVTTLKAAGDAILDGYLAAIDTGTLEDQQCRLYCKLKAAGSWSYDTFHDFVSEGYDAAGIGNPALQSLYNNFLQFTPAEIEKRALIGSLQPSTECETLCDDCPDEPTGEVWVLTASGSYTQLLPDVDNKYTATGEYLDSGKYYLNVQWSETYDKDLCNGITITDDDVNRENYQIKYRCHDEVNDALSVCYARTQFRANVPFTIKFTLDNDAPCT